MERRLYYISDIHLEIDDVRNDIIFNLSDDEKIENYLALCGDIGNPFQDNYEQFIIFQSKVFKRVFIITGNHEYYCTNTLCKTMRQVDEKIQEICNKFENVTFLNMSQSEISIFRESEYLNNIDEPFELQDTLFVGCTLWTEVDSHAERVMNDYNKIYIDDPYFLQDSKNKIKYMDILQLHGEMITYLEEVTINKKEYIKQIIVLTHHAPTFKMLKDKEIEEPNSFLMPSRQDKCDHYYASNCEYLFNPLIKCWISGHTHECKEVFINNIPSLSNCYGYLGQKTGVSLEKYISF